MRNHLLCIMSLSGSAIVFLYGLFYFFIKKYFSILQQKLILEFAIFFYLCPVSLLKDTIFSYICKLFPSLLQNFSDMPSKSILDINYVINVYENKIYIGSEVKFFIIFTAFMCMIAILIIVRKLRQYYIIRHAFSLPFFSESLPSDLTEQFEQIKNELGIKRTIKLVCSQWCQTPATIGVFNPTIVFPVFMFFDLPTTSFKYILKHELLHIKRYDFLIKFLALLALALHWYNPICYVLYYELCIVVEMSCDYDVIKNGDNLERQEYSNLILELAAAASHSKKSSITVGLVNGSSASIKRRILEMKTTRKNRPILMGAITLLICAIGSTIAFAYEAPQKLDLVDFDPSHEYLFSFSAGQEVSKAEVLPYESFFTDEEGNIFPMNTSTVAPKIGCLHHLVEGTVSEHTKNSSGGCLVIVREGWRCSICGYVKSGDVISETKYTICPH